MSQKQNRFFGMIHDFGGEARLVVLNQRDAVFAGNIFGGYDDEFDPVRIWAKRNLFDLAARHAAAHRRAVKHAGQNHVIDISRRSSNFFPAFFAWNGGPDDVRNVHRYLAAVFCLKRQQFQISI